MKSLSFVLFFAFIIIPFSEGTFAQELTDHLSWSGFVDARHVNRSSEGIAPSAQNSGFLLHDAALYLDWKKDKTSAFIDLPFSRSGTGDANFSFAQTKGQAYIGYQVNERTRLQLGQFDSFYGFESNDSLNRLFSTAGVLHQKVTPTVQVGLRSESTWNDFCLKLVVADPADRGDLGTGNTVNTNHEYGVNLGYSNGTYRGNIAYLLSASQNLEGGSAQRELLNVTAGFSLGDFSLDGEYDFLSDPQKDVLTASSTDKEKAGQGFLVLLQYQLAERWTMGARYENVTDGYLQDSSQDPDVYFVSNESYGIAAHYKIDENLEARTEFVSYKTQETSGGAKTDSNLFALGALLRF